MYVLPQWKTKTQQRKDLGKLEVTANGYWVSFKDDENILELIVVIVTKLWEYTNSHCIIPFKWVSYEIYKFCLNTAVTKIKSPGRH